MSQTYSGTQAHYLSPKRRDPVKRYAEEPISRAVLRDAVDRIGLPEGAPVRVLDLGCGIGDGLELLAELDREVDYTGLDSDQGMIETASARAPHARFVRADMRDPLPDADFDLYMSSGVPYSHLPAEEIEAVLCRIFERITARGHRASVVADVLGRYSVEWAPNWDHERWDYAMTFFEAERKPQGTPMTFLSSARFGELITNAARRAGVSLPWLDFVDRSVLLGRHTATGTFNPELPAYRRMVNELSAGEPVEFERLLFQAPESGAPAEVLEFFTGFAERWNTAVHTAIEEGAAPSALAESLLRCERETRGGIGAGHSLIASMLVEV